MQGKAWNSLQLQPSFWGWADHKRHSPRNPGGFVNNGLEVMYTVRTCLTMPVLAPDFPTWQAS